MIEEDDAPAEIGCPRCGSSIVETTETRLPPRATGDGLRIEVRKRVTLCKSCGEVIATEEIGARPEAPAPVAPATPPAAPPVDPPAAPVAQEAAPAEEAAPPPKPLLEID